MQEQPDIAQELPPVPRLLACRYPLHLAAEKQSISTHTPSITLHIFSSSSNFRSSSAMDQASSMSPVPSDGGVQL
ncbi:Os07g0269450 [Oryza sativa Japonica Group]|uniref:Os07g0269450 protein n=1 Tax=Oryza sativa subsp. japonica TaxID=39947 RepID=A0A0P0X4M6_ORYSJ|nr:hypothetical protein EE612_038405 [Oryza sativa]BAT00931.1 Os07g0269450 [Oryza sativa Japonica Group]